MKKSQRVKHKTFDDFYKHNKQDVLRYTERILKNLGFLAEDVVQESFYVLSKKDRWKLPYGRCFLFKTAKNKAIDIMRKEKPSIDIFDVSYGLAAKTQDIYRETEIEKEKLYWDRAACSCLSPLQYHVYILRVHDSLSIDQIAKEIGKTKEKVHVYISIMRKKMSKYRDDFWRRR